MSGRLPGPPSRLDLGDFLELYAGIYEHSAWIAEQSWRQGLREEHDLSQGLAALMRSQVDAAERERQLALIRAHPDLADRTAIDRGLTDFSLEEQRSAALDACTEDEYRRFQTLNRQYKKRFGFPFVIAVKGLARGDILRAFESRIGSALNQEFDQALQQIHEIALLRLQAIEAIP